MIIIFSRYVLQCCYFTVLGARACLFTSMLLCTAQFNELRVKKLFENDIWNFAILIENFFFSDFIFRSDREFFVIVCRSCVLREFVDWIFFHHFQLWFGSCKILWKNCMQVSFFQFFFFNFDKALPDGSQNYTGIARKEIRIGFILVR